MNIFKFKNIILIFSFIFSSNIYPEETALTKSNLYQEIAKENLKSLTDVDTNIGLAESIGEYEKNGAKAFFESKLNNQLNLDQTSKQRLILSLLSEYYDKNKFEKTNVLDEITWQDLNLLSGPKSKPGMYLAAEISNGRTVTGVGAATILRMLVQPNADVQKLLIQQNVTKKLLTDENLFNQLDSKLKEMVIPENVLLSFWDKEDFFAFGIRNDRKKIPFSDKADFLKKISDKINNTPALLELINRTQKITGYAARAVMIYGVADILFHMFTGHDIIQAFPGVDKFNKLPVLTVSGALILLANKLAKNSNILSGIEKSIIIGNSVYDNASYAYGVIEDEAFFKCLLKKMTYLVTYLKNLQNMVNFINKYPELVKALPAVQKFVDSYQDLRKKSFDFEKLIKLLETDTFKKEFSWSTYFSRVIVAYNLMCAQKENFVEAMLAVGELDAQLAIAKLYKEFENKRVKFCFPEFITENVNTPAISAKDFWNPMVNSEIVVPNSLSLGNYFNQVNNVIITGPNAGGKSTTMKGLLISIILAQSLGIAPASELKFTPFGKIMTYLNITDDIAAGNSHFKAGVIRARELITTVQESQALGNNQFSLTAVDEVFNGTTPVEGQAAAYSMIKLLGNYNQNICLTATHFPAVTGLENTEHDKFVNYKVSVLETTFADVVASQQNWEIKYPYILEPGISHQNVAFKILKQQGFGDLFLNEAQNTLQALMV
ncbi:MAG: hypothetical protein SZ59_C0002G0250 [candidate division TM6 bacterium GW2011_GWF2_28_16]|nr:MAG: hypothetical protein SZ59_C0002G0250 [candidate division TM6 bacterium GW2011_GWF2_28_16]